MQASHTVLMVIDRDAARPLYLQLADELRVEIERGDYPGKIPSITALASMYDIAAVTVRKALDVLRAEGLLEFVPGRGTYVKQSAT